MDRYDELLDIIVSPFRYFVIEGDGKCTVRFTMFNSKTNFVFENVVSDESLYDRIKSSVELGIIVPSLVGKVETHNIPTFMSGDETRRDYPVWRVL